jgi:hypothetical protein
MNKIEHIEVKFISGLWEKQYIHNGYICVDGVLKNWT